MPQAAARSQGAGATSSGSPFVNPHRALGDAWAAHGGGGPNHLLVRGRCGFTGFNSTYGNFACFSTVRSVSWVRPLVLVQSFAGRNLMKTDSCSANCGCGSGLGRRAFIKFLGLGATAALAQPWHAMAGPFTEADFEKLVPADKKLDPGWVRSPLRTRRSDGLPRQGPRNHRHARRGSGRRPGLPRGRWQTLALGHFQPAHRFGQQRPSLCQAASASIPLRTGLCRPPQHGRNLQSPSPRSHRLERHLLYWRVPHWPGGSTETRRRPSR